MSNETELKKNIAKVKSNKQKATIDKKTCPCAKMNISSTVALKAFQKGSKVYYITQEFVTGTGKTTVKDVIFSQCTKTCQEGTTYCAIHNKVPEPVILKDFLLENNDSILIEDENNELLHRTKGKKATPRKNHYVINNKIIENDDLYENFIKQVQKIECDILQKNNRLEHEQMTKNNKTSKTTKNKTSKITETLKTTNNKKKNVKSKAEEVEDSEDDDDQQINVNESDEEDEHEEVVESDEEEDEKEEQEEEENNDNVEDSDEEINEDDEEKFETIETIDGREFLKKNDNTVYGVEDTEKCIGKYYEVSNTNALIHNSSDDSYYIIGKQVKAGRHGTKILCVISNDLYNEDLTYYGKKNGNKVIKNSNNNDE